MINFVRKLTWRNKSEGAPETIVYKEDLLRYENGAGDLSALFDTGSLSPANAARRFDACPMQAGLFYGPSNGPFAATTPDAGTVIGYRLAVGRSSTIKSLSVNVTVPAGGAAIRLGLYKFLWTPTGWTTTLILDAGTVDASTTGIKTITVTVPVEVGDIIVPVAVTQGGASLPSFGAAQGADAPLGATQITSAVNAVAGLKLTGVTGALPATPIMTVSGTAPRVAVGVGT